MQRKLIVVSAIFSAVFVLALTVDVPIARWAAAKGAPGELRKVLDLAEVFAHGSGVFFILVTIFLLDPLRRIRLFRVAVSAYGGGLAADVVKLFIGRTRPTKLGLADFDGTVGDTFLGFMPFNLDNSAAQSFPSAHTAVAFGLAISLGTMYPRGKNWFLLIAVLAGLQRIQFSHHYPSDVIAGALIGTLAAFTCSQSGWLGPRFDKIEQSREPGS